MGLPVWAGATLMATATASVLRAMVMTGRHAACMETCKRLCTERAELKKRLAAVTAQLGAAAADATAEADEASADKARLRKQLAELRKQLAELMEEVLAQGEELETARGQQQKGKGKQPPPPPKQPPPPSQEQHRPWWRMAQAGASPPAPWRPWDVAPAMNETASMGQLKAFLTQAGAAGRAARCSEKAELLCAAKAMGNAWEIRRILACGQLSEKECAEAVFRRRAPVPLSHGAAVPPELTATYRLLSLRVHPDKNPTDPLATAAFQHLVAAYKQLAPGAAA